MKSQKNRRLAAIMFTDIVGYTALMQKDEKSAAAVRARHREVFQDKHQEHNGEIIQYFGDGTLSAFQSGVEAVECAIAIQKMLGTEDGIPLRIGLHIGDIVFDGIEIYGDGVNFASRIESMGVAGAILISGQLNEELKNHLHISTVSLGSFELKNITEPVEVFAVDNDGIKTPSPSELKGKQKKHLKTIAVLPFANFSSDPENEYFTDGMTEEIINALAKIKALKVTSRTSSFYFKNKNIPISQIGKELNVGIILEGSIRLSGKAIRITAQLIDVAEDYHFWSETWDRKLENVFEIQDEISLLIADKLREQFGHFEIQEHLVAKQTESFDAYEYSLKAKFHFNKWNPEDMHTAISLYNKALELDDKHVESYLGLADCYGFLATTGFMGHAEAWQKASQLTHKAHYLNDQHAGVYYQLANLAFFTAVNYKEAVRLTIKALEIQPNYVEAQQFMSFLYLIAGKRDRGFVHLNKALEIDPLSQETLFYKGYYNYITENYEQAIEVLDRCLKHNPKNIPASTVKSYCLIKQNRLDEAINYFDTIPSDIVIEADKIGVQAIAYALKNDVVNSEKLKKRLLEFAQNIENYHAQSYLFMLYAATGENDKAFEWIREAMENNSPLLHLHFVDPLVNSIKTDPRYPEFQKVIFQEVPEVKKVKTKKSLLDQETAMDYSSRLLKYIQDEKPFLDPNLSLRTLAEQIKINPNQLSWLLNESLNKNFSEFINGYRVQHFKGKVADASQSHLTLLALAYDSGFNSKTVFNTFFKKITGQTPKEYWKEVTKK
tara:strand:+ start:538 stop:2871 length:2334 start_codon:yes stop_codon:yes gene_type:complete